MPGQRPCWCCGHWRAVLPTGYAFCEACQVLTGAGRIPLRETGVEWQLATGYEFVAYIDHGAMHVSSPG